MTISTPVTSNAKKHRTVIQWVTRTTAVCRGPVIVVGAIAESATRGSYHSLPPKGGRVSGWRKRPGQASDDRIIDNPARGTRDISRPRSWVNLACGRSDPAAPARTRYDSRFRTRSPGGDHRLQ